MSTRPFDPRVTPARRDLAASFLQGRVEASRFVEGRTMQVRAAVAALRRFPQPDAELDTEALCGERVIIFDEQEGWAWGQLERDGYVGYLSAGALGAARPEGTTHKVAALRSFVFPAPNAKLPPLDALPFGASVRECERSGDFLSVEGGFIWHRHLVPVDAYEDDFVAVAERFLGVPYLWGGKTALGIDCSGLVQLALQATGRAAARDSDHQEETLGVRVAAEAPLRRGDLVFWPGHVGIMRDADILLHANGYAMMVTADSLRDVQARIESEGGGLVTSVRRV